MLVALVFVACLGQRCEQVQLPWDGSAVACMMFGQQLAAQWVAERAAYPYTVARGYRCETGQPT